ncbi:integral membrane protein [Hypomontagnella monticulosa]|nr:integral membrane protein [Hypomontagnella monticulosa]
MADISDRAVALLVCIIVFTVLCTLSLWLRYVASRVSRRSFYLDDLFVVLAYVSTISLEGAVIWAISNGMGKHINELSEYEIKVQSQMIILAGTIPWLFACVFSKLSILFFYNRVFATKEFRRWSNGLIAIVVCYCITFLAVYMTNCRPIDQLWNPVPWGSCREMSISDFATLGTNITLDIAVIILPMPVLWNLQMPLRNKISVSVMFSIGFITIAVMGWRVAAAAQTRSNPDYTYNFPLTAVLSLCELWLGIIVACIPTLAPLLNAYIKPALGRLTSSLTGGSRREHDSEAKSVSLGTVNNSRRGGAYSELEDGSQERIFESNPTPGMAITTECVYEPPSRALFSGPNNSGIHVQQEVTLATDKDEWPGPKAY